MTDKKTNHTSKIADWITIITGPITFLTAIFALLGSSSEEPLLLHVTNYQKIALWLVITMVIFIFFLEIAIKLPRLLYVKKISSLPFEPLFVVSNIFMLIAMIALQLVSIESIFGVSGDSPLVRFVCLIYPILWLLILCMIGFFLKGEESK